MITVTETITPLPGTYPDPVSQAIAERRQSERNAKRETYRAALDKAIATGEHAALSELAMIGDDAGLTSEQINEHLRLGRAAASLAVSEPTPDQWQVFMTAGQALAKLEADFEKLKAKHDAACKPHREVVDGFNARLSSQRQLKSDHERAQQLYADRVRIDLR